MMATSNPDSNGIAEPEQAVALPVMKWQVRLYQEAPSKRWGILGTAILATAAGWMLFHNILLPLVAILAIFGSTTEFWLPISYVFNDNGGTARCGLGVSAIEWSDVKRALIYETQVKLTPIETDTRLGEFRGVVFRFGDRKQEVLDYVEKRLGKQCLIFGTKN